MNGTVSIIVPVYNVEPYLPRCVDSLVTQTYPHLEILLVNDGSADQSGEICDAYAARDSRVHAFHKANGGAADARNFGLDHMTGAYLMFLDADDWLDPTCVENCMMEFMSDFAPTCVMFPYVREFPSTGKAVYILGEKRLEISGREGLPCDACRGTSVSCNGTCNAGGGLSVQRETFLSDRSYRVPSRYFLPISAE